MAFHDRQLPFPNWQTAFSKRQGAFPNRKTTFRDWKLSFHKRQTAFPNRTDKRILMSPVIFIRT